VAELDVVSVYYVVEAKIAAALNHPTRDPHGAPIPSLNGEIAKDGWTPVCELATGTRAVVRRVSDENADILRHLRDLKILPGTEIEILRAVAAEGVLRLRVEGRRRTLGFDPARSVFVEVRSP
jgi:DtxR family Mn-dependent transcriptional regulator